MKTALHRHPRLIQGGMGIGVSGWELAKAVSQTGQLGTVSITGIWQVITGKLQLGDPGGHIRRALGNFPSKEIAERIIKTFYVEGGVAELQPFRSMSMFTLPLRQAVVELLVAASFVEVWLAKEGHSGLVAVNGLEKIQLAHLPSLYGAMLAGVDYVLMGAGIPLQIAEALDTMAEHQPATYRLTVEGALPEEITQTTFDPRSLHLAEVYDTPLKRPYFFPIISSHVLAQMFTKHGSRKADGFIVEGFTAGGHNAPPRNRVARTETGEPLYTEKDLPDLRKMAPDLPFWLAGSVSHPDSLAQAQEQGAYGIQAGSIFALCQESAIEECWKERVKADYLADRLVIRTNPQSSPSGYPFKEAQLPGTLTEEHIYQQRQRICDIGALRTLYRKENGKVGFRCPAEPVESYVKKGGNFADTAERRCLCNTLCATVGLGQRRPGSVLQEEPPLITIGEDLHFLHDLAPDGGTYTARQAVQYLVSSP